MEVVTCSGFAPLLFLVMAVRASAVASVTNFRESCCPRTPSGSPPSKRRIRPTAHQRVVIRDRRGHVLEVSDPEREGPMTPPRKLIARDPAIPRTQKQRYTELSPDHLRGCFPPEPNTCGREPQSGKSLIRPSWRRSSLLGHREKHFESGLGQVAIRCQRCAEL